MNKYIYEYSGFNENSPSGIISNSTENFDELMMLCNKYTGYEFTVNVFSDYMWESESDVINRKYKKVNSFKLEKNV